MFKFSVLFILVLLAACSAFRPMASRMALKVARASALSMSESDESASGKVVMSEAENVAAKKELFDMNERVRLGRSRDQDGKSNIWSIEPRMEVEEEEGDQTKKNLLIAGGVIGVAIACLPIFQAFSKLVPDPSDY